VGGLLVPSAGTAYAASSDIVISQVYGGGGNSGAPYHNDFVELYNRGGSTVSISGWTLQYASSSGNTWLSTPLSGSIAPGHHYLVQEAAGSGGGAALPPPDATGSTRMSSSSAKVALVTDSSELTCSNACEGKAGVKDFVGYGSRASSSESAPTGNLSNTTAALRAGGGAVDTDDNSADFTVTAPAPRNSTSGGGTGGGTRIHDIQGAAHVSPMNGQDVSDVAGVVTAASGSGFWMQDPQPDGDPATSEGVFVYTGGAPTVQAGDSVTVGGTVSEYRSGGAGSDSLTTTEITGPTVTVVAGGVTPPAATPVGPGGRVPPSSVIEDDATGDVENSGVFDPAGDGIDFWESMEGMRVEIDDAAVVGPRNKYGEIPVVPQGSTIRTNRGGIVMRSADANPERVLLDDVLASTPTVNVGDTLSGATTGVLDYSFGNFKLLNTKAPSVTDGGLQRETTQTPAADELSAATFNVENLDPTDAQSKFDGLAGQIVHNLKSPDLISLEEVQDDNGATDDGTVSCDRTMSKLIGAISAAGGPDYGYRQISPSNDADGGEPGGNIRNVFLFRTDRGLSFVDRSGGTATRADSVVNNGGVPSLTYSPGRIDPTDSAWSSSRKPLVGEFTWHGRTFFAVANHFNSKGGDQPLFGHDQPPAHSSETQRHQQASLVKDFVDQILAVDAQSSVLVMGDLNDYDFSETADILTANGSLVDLPRTLPAAERYSYVYEGNSQVLDHILLSPGLAAAPYSYDVVHTNSEFADQLSDHDPQVVRVQLP
jgi:predicted extracellular nuclease